MYTQTVTVRIDETTVGDLRGEQVAAGNAFDADYTLANGETAHGPTMALYVFEGDQKHRVGAGSELTVGGRTWSVTQVDLGSGGLGWVELQAKVSADRSPAKSEDLDFFFSSRCQRCGGQTGWDGSVSFERGRPVVGTRCIRCPEHELLTGGRVEQVFFDGPPVFTAGRRPS